MSLSNLLTIGNRKPSDRRRPRVFRPALYPTLEGLEQRTVLSAAAASAVMAAPVAMQSPLQITGAHITQLVATSANTLTATVDLTGNLITKAGVTPFTLPNLTVPITLTSLGQSSDGCPILHLALEIPDLNLLGLHLQLDNCNNGPVTVDVTAIPSGQDGGGLLGDVLCGVSNLLGTTDGLLNLNLTSPVSGFTGTAADALSQAFNTVLGSLAAGGGGGSMGGGGDQAPAGTCELVNLHLGEIDLNVLGLRVQTSEICLLAYADPNGGLLGDLLCSLNNLLNNNGNNAHAAQVLLRNLSRLNILQLA